MTEPRYAPGDAPTATADAPATRVVRLFRHLLPTPASPAVRAEQVRLLYQQGPTIQGLGVVTAVVMLATLWPVADHRLLLLWFAIHLALSALRLISVARFNRHATPDDAARWGATYTVGAFTSGLVWGGLSLFFDPAWPPAFQAILFALYTGITAGAFNTHSAYFMAFPAFYLPPALCLGVVILERMGPGTAQLGTLLAIYIVLMYLSALKYHNRLAESLEARFENERLAAELAASNRRLAHLAEIDELTGLHNRRALDQRLASEWSRHQRRGQPLSLLFIDVDFFKQYNDCYGHDGGDRSLIQVAGLLRDHAQRASDLAARFGGEEFAVVLPETDATQALRIAEALRAALERRQIPHIGSGIARVLTMSIGVATALPTAPDGADSLRIAADRALYRAKAAGRNRVVSAGD